MLKAHNAGSSFFSEFADIVVVLITLQIKFSDFLYPRRLKKRFKTKKHGCSHRVGGGVGGGQIYCFDWCQAVPAELSGNVRLDEGWKTLGSKVVTVVGSGLSKYAAEERN